MHSLGLDYGRILTSTVAFQDDVSLITTDTVSKQSSTYFPEENFIVRRSLFTKCRYVYETSDQS